MSNDGRLPFLPRSEMLWSMEPSALAALLANIAEWSRSAAKPDEASLPDGSRRPPLPMAISDGVATITLRGPMERRASLFGTIFGLASTDAIRESVREAAANSDVRSVLLEIDSPGGSVDGLAELGDAVRSLRGSKQVVAQVDGTAASAAYYVAAQADKVYAGRTDLVGSIGTKLTLLDASKMFEESGVRVVSIDSGGLKSAGEYGTEITGEVEDYFRGLVDFYFDDFVKAVSAGRGMSAAAVRKVASGEIFPAPRAQSLGLVDGLQSLDETRSKLASRRIRRRSSRTARAEVELW